MQFFFEHISHNYNRISFRMTGAVLIRIVQMMFVIIIIFTVREM